MFDKKADHKYKHLYAYQGRFAWFYRFNVLSKLIFVLFLILVVAVVWLGGAAVKWKVQKKNYRERISVLRTENEALRVEKDLMITRMTLAGLIKPIQDGEIEYIDEEEDMLYLQDAADDVGYTEVIAFTNFNGSYNPANNNVKITFKILNIHEGPEEKVEGRIFIVLGDTSLPPEKRKIMPDDAVLQSDGLPDGTKGGSVFSIREFKDMTFNGAIDKNTTSDYDTGMIYVYSMEGELIQILPLHLDFSNPAKIITFE